MRSPSRLTAAAVVAAVTLFACAGRAQDSAASMPLHLRAGRVSLSGSSNLRDYACRTTAIDAAIAVDRDTVSGPAPIQAPVVHVAVRVPLATLDCGLPGVKRDLLHTLHGDVNPDVTYRLDSYDLVRLSGNADTAELRAIGTLTVAGVARRVEMDVTGTRHGDSTVSATAAVSMHMTDFGIAPPRLFFGTLRVRDAITIQFDLTADLPRPGGF